uniref:Uncharacterized protein n=1 Tax=virus sp. ctBM815 TaxID=2825806 RepID=A0A8S5RL41_9VIRU|nr:MAG TPA: hypothetical protein [virus sp. ctBM815]
MFTTVLKIKKIFLFLVFILVKQKIKNKIFGKLNKKAGAVNPG